MRGSGLQILFAGGIHDARSAAMVSALAAGLAEQGVAIGVLMGTAYLFTHEAVDCGAIVLRFQSEALTCRETVLLESGPGHEIRCVKSPYADLFAQTRQRLQQAGRTSDEIRAALELLNVGRLRLASKGVERAQPPQGTWRELVADSGKNGLDKLADMLDPRDVLSAVDLAPQPTRTSTPLVTATEEEQFARGMYMIGQVAALREGIVGMADLHADVCTMGTRLLQGPILTPEPSPLTPSPCDIAIVGMSAFFPGAGDLRTYWANILAKTDSVTEVPESHWDWKLYYDADMRAVDHIYSKWGGFLGDVTFEPLQFGMPPSSLEAIEPVQLMVLEAARQAFRHAGYLAERSGKERGLGLLLSPRTRERTAVILGIGGGGSPKAFAYGFRSSLPIFETAPALGLKAGDLLQHFLPALPDWTEDSFPGMLSNVAAGRVANRFDFGGPNFVVDAACASSLCALQAGIRELQGGVSDVALVMAADTVQTPFAYMGFCRTFALSPKGRCKPFDAAADGIVLSEGVAALVLKRLADAERDGDRVYAVIKGIGASSDGKDKGLTAPRPEGQLRAIRRAWDMAGLSPTTAGLIEAHGTGTVVGDQTEAQVLTRTFREAANGSTAPISCALGSVKSIIGHAKCAAGLAGLIKSVLALHHKVLPPTLVQKPNPKIGLDDSPLFLNTEPLPWVHGETHPRRAAVSAFGFGGTNFHVVVEEYTGDYLAELNEGRHDQALPHWPAELLVWRTPHRTDLISAVSKFQGNLAATDNLVELAGSLVRSLPAAKTGTTLAIVATSLDDLRTKLTFALEQLAKGDGTRSWSDPRGIFYSERIDATSPPIAFLFPGQGSQYPGMLAQAAMAFPEVRQAFDRAEQVLAGRFDRPLARLVFPAPAFTPEQDKKAREALTRSEVAQPAVAAASLGMCRLLESFGVHPDFLAGHSFGEYVALCAAGSLAPEDLYRLAYRRGQIIKEAGANGGMAAIEANWDTLAPLLAGMDGVCLANQNAPRQTVLSGITAGLQNALEKLKGHNIRGQIIPVACPFHSPWIASAREPLARALAECRLTSPRRPVYTNVTANRYPSEPGAIANLLVDHLTSPVRFQDEIVALFEAGARVFVEVGPQAVLTGLASQTLSERCSGQALAVASDAKGRAGLTQLLHLLAQLIVQGVPVRLDRLFSGRVPAAKPDTSASGATPWLVNSVRVRPVNGPEKPVLGRALPAPASGSHQPAEKTWPQEADALRLPGEANEALAQFQQMMSKFLDTQRSVMLGYLRGGSTAPPLPATIAPTPVPAPKVVVPQAPEPMPVSLNGKAPIVDRESLTQRLIDILSKRTGYPTEMLTPDVDLEAELGIDSIKHVEILGTLAEELHGDTSKLSLPEMEKLVAFKTVRGIVGYLVERAEQEPNVVAQLQAVATNGHARPPVAIHRLLVESEPLPAAPAQPNLRRPASGVLLITDDGRGLAAALADRLDEQGQPVVILGLAELSNLTDASVLDRIREKSGPLAGVIHLLPLAALNSSSVSERMRHEIQSLFLLARGVAQDLSSDNPGLVLTVTSMGGRLGLLNIPTDFFPGQGGVVGLVKCLAHEWPGALIRAVDLEPSALSPDQLATTADRLLAELGDGAAPVEIGYVGDQRLTLRCVPTPHQETETDLKLGPESVILLTGGARGITAAVALDMARRYRPRLVLVGRSPPPPDQEEPDTADLTTPAEIKAVLMDRLRRDNQAVAPVVVESSYQRLLQEREVRANLEAMRQAGARVHYFSADVRDPIALRTVLAVVQRQFGGIDGIVHGAGVIADRLVRDKTLESFQKVFATKVDSALVLAEQLSERLKFLVFFTSVAGRFGNRGQSDYAAANEVLSKLAIALDRRGPTRVVSVAWGPWSGVGMATGLEPHMTRLGVRLIAPNEGPRWLDEELRFGARGQCEVVITGDVTTWINRDKERRDDMVLQEEKP